MTNIEFENHNIAALIQSAVCSCTSIIEAKEMSVSIDCTDDLTALLDPILMEQAIINIVDNAVKYTKEGWVVVKVYKQNGNVQIEVADTGIGIPKTDMPKLFQKFIRAKNAKDMYTDGSGLGLFIIKKIVESHPGGKVWVKSEEGQGSKFFIRLPAAN